ncbi:hypothetical protein HUG17_8564 [Dermatophagoides farinae]|uniref:Uncharacterized protein n=1 Tax=Dermatophagoides farinae TaxID=6954 RepID=A0A9D4SHC2_DERFA|nr:hypothetical protein HUG17_8564 [Dermatophagoides farinae]
MVDERTSLFDHNNNTTTRYYMVIDFACHNEMSLYHFIANCPQYAKQMDHLEVEPKSSSLFVVNKYLDSYPADFREHDSQLLRCQSDFTQSPIKRPTDQRYPCIGHYFRCSHNHNDCHCLLVESSM